MECMAYNGRAKRIEFPAFDVQTEFFTGAIRALILMSARIDRILRTIFKHAF